MEVDGDCSKGNKEEPRVSGTYIRTLVKQLASSRTKDTTNNPKNPISAVGDDQLQEKSGERCGEISQNNQTQQPQPHKKQVRRRLHTSRPYQERLLNMAEARREIVTALKQHRATMKQQASEQQKLQQQETQPEPMQVSSQMCLEQDARSKSRRNPRIYPLTDSSNCLDGFPCSCFQNHPHRLPPDPFSWPVSQIQHPSASHPLNFVLPHQPLGLNLNFQDFNNIETSLYHNPTYNIPTYSSPSSSSSPGMSIASEEIPFTVTSHEVGLTPPSDGAESSGGLHHQVLDDEEMAEIRSLGEQHQIEWNDTMNLVTSACWSKFLSTIELEPEIKTEDDGYHPFDEAMEFPSWLNNTNEPYFTDYSSDDYPHDPALPCMEIGEIEGIDGEWLG